MDDVIVYGASMQEHDTRLKRVMETVEFAVLRLNKDKCKIRQTELHFLGQVVDENSVRADPEKVKAIAELKAPHELKRVLGMINYMVKYISHLATLGGPLYELLRTETAWTWDSAQERAFRQLKEALMTSPVLSFYDAEKQTTVSADASSYGLGGVLLQQHGDCWKPIAYCSRTLTSAECHYAQIEKECLAGVWACEHFSKYLSGLGHFKLITDHKPLVPLINCKDLDNVPIRCQRLLLRLMRFNVTAEYAPGKTLVVADTLSRSPQSSTVDSTTEEDISCYVNAIVESLPASNGKIKEIRDATQQDEKLQRVKRLITIGWPEHARDVHPLVRDFHAFKSELSETDGLLTRGNRIIIPESLRGEIIERIHEGHLGLTKCRERAQTSVWWPGLSSELKQKIEKCKFCCEHRKTQRKEPLSSTPLPDRPWQRLGVDLCEYEGKNYIVLSDYYSRFLELLHLSNTTAEQVVIKLKATFAQFGIPEVVVSDNGPQFTSETFRSFSHEFDFVHITSRPHHPSSNGHAERAVQSAKAILRQKDPVLALLSYRTTPHASTGVSPAELLMGWRLRNTLPTLERNLNPKWPDQRLIRR